MTTLSFENWKRLLGRSINFNDTHSQAILTKKHLSYYRPFELGLNFNLGQSPKVFYGTWWRHYYHCTWVVCFVRTIVQLYQKLRRSGIEITYGYFSLSNSLFFWLKFSYKISKDFQKKFKNFNCVLIIVDYKR